MNLNHRLHARRHGLVHRARNPLYQPFDTSAQCYPLLSPPLPPAPPPPRDDFRRLRYGDLAIEHEGDFNRRGGGEGTGRGGGNAVSFFLLLLSFLALFSSSSSPPLPPSSFAGITNRLSGASESRARLRERVCRRFKGFKGVAKDGFGVCESARGLLIYLTYLCQIRKQRCIDVREGQHEATM